MTQIALRNNKEISFKGSIRINCDHAHKIARNLGKSFQAGIREANKELMASWDDSVLLVEPVYTKTKRKVLKVCLDKNPEQNKVITLFNKSTQDLKKEFIDAFKKLSKLHGEKPAILLPEIGDVLAISTERPLSKIIKALTGYNISHVDLMINRKECFYAYMPKPTIKRISRYISDPKNEKVYLCKLTETNRSKILEDKVKFDELIKESKKKKYSVEDLVLFPIKKAFKIAENTKKILCSENVSYIYRRFGFIPDKTNVSRISPGEVVDFNTYTNVFERIARIK